MTETTTRWVCPGCGYVYDEGTGDLVTTTSPFAGTQPSLTPVAIAAGRLYTGAQDGTVIAFHA